MRQARDENLLEELVLILEAVIKHFQVKGYRIIVENEKPRFILIYTQYKILIIEL